MPSAKSLLYVLAAAAATPLLLRLAVQVLEPLMTFHPMRSLSRTPRDEGVPFTSLEVETSDGERICTWLMRHPGARAEILFFHGNAGNLSIWLDFLLPLYRRSFTVLAFDYRGFGTSSGSPTEAGIYRDSEAMVRRFWSEFHQPGLPVIYFGRSLGGVTASYATTVIPPHGLILEATFPDKATLLRHYPVLGLLGRLSRYRFPTVEFLQDFKGPILLLHGDADRVVPLEVGRELFARLEGEKELVVLPGGGHNDLYLQGSELYWKRLEAFVSRLRHGQDPD